MVKVIMSGCAGRMGHVISDLVKEDEEITIAAGVDPAALEGFSYPVFPSFEECNARADVIIDFSSPKAFAAMMDYAEKIGVDPKDMFVVSVMPCTAKKYEIQRPEMQNGGNFNVDAVLTTRELARMIRTMGIDFRNLEDGTFDAPLGFSTGAADIFGVTGGVMEAALRTVYELVTGRELPGSNLHLVPIMGLEKIKEADVTFENVKPEYSFLEGVTAKIAVTSGLKNADILLEQVKNGTSPYHFIEVMGCPGGCINGGGQPRIRNNVPNYKELRIEALYNEDEGKKLRKSHENPDLMELYKVFLEKPGSHLAHELLHTTYTPRGHFNEWMDPAFQRRRAAELAQAEAE